MTREIKFRAKVKHHNPITNPENGWVEGYYLQDLTQGEMRSYIFNCPCYWEVLPETVGQFTGLLDKNGKEIYEGDIILTPFLDPIFGDMVNGELCVKREVLFNKGSFVVKKDIGYVYLECFTKDNNAKVIGNIHDNPELLKTETL